MEKMNGIDYTLYLVYLRYAGWLCLILTIINCVTMIPIYASGKPKNVDDWRQQNKSSMNNLTILNITDSEYKFDFVYLYTIIFVSGFAYCMIIFYRKKYDFYKTKYDPQLDKFDDIAVARYSLLVSHLPKNYGVENLQTKITS